MKYLIISTPTIPRLPEFEKKEILLKNFKFEDYFGYLNSIDIRQNLKVHLYMDKLKDNCLFVAKWAICEHETIKY